jgi:tRNA U34 5-carboxymethylaminomethyl modifying GTPase MnmE/TrmE
MESYDLPLVEKLEQVYVLSETYQLLLNQLGENHHDTASAEIIKEDLKKIEQELVTYTGEKYKEDLASMLNKEFFFPDTYDDYE